MYRFPQFTFPSSLSRWLGAAILGSLVGNSHAASADSPVPASGDPLTGILPASLMQTGAGAGTAGQNPHPNAVTPPGLGEQAAAARRRP